MNYRVPRRSAMHPAKFLFGIAAVAVLVVPAFGRLLEDWSYERLFKEADFVVVATAGKPEDSNEEFSPKMWNIELHYRLPEGVLVNDGPLLVSFRDRPLPLRCPIRTAPLLPRRTGGPT